MSASTEYYLQGRQGGVVLSGADSATGDFRWLQVVSDAVLLTDTGETASSNVADIINLDGVTLPAGMGIGGSFSKVQIASGVVIAYYA